MNEKSRYELMTAATDRIQHISPRQKGPMTRWGLAIKCRMLLWTKNRAQVLIRMSSAWGVAEHRNSLECNNWQHTHTHIHTHTRTAAPALLQKHVTCKSVYSSTEFILYFLLHHNATLELQIHFKWKSDDQLKQMWCTFIDLTNQQNANTLYKYILRW